MKSFWIKPDIEQPFKATTIDGVIYANVLKAQTVADRALTRQEVTSLVKVMKERGLVDSGRSKTDLANSFLRKLKKAQAVQESKP